MGASDSNPFDGGAQPPQSPAARSGAPDAIGVQDADWQRLVAASSDEAFFAAWLACQCRAIPETRTGLLLVGPPGRGPFAPAAVWPHARVDFQALANAAERALAERCALVLEPSAASTTFEVVQPIELDGELCGAAVVSVAERSQAELALAMRQLRWGLEWVSGRLRQGQREVHSARTRRMGIVLDLAAAASERDSFEDAATHLATEIATRLACDRVSLGFLRRGGAIELAAMSNSAQFGEKSNLVRSIEAAMDEALEQQRTLVWPSTDPQDAAVVRAHAELARELGASAVLSARLTSGDDAIGVMTLERGGEHGFDAEDMAVCEATAALVAPVLDLRRREDRSILAKLGSWVADRTADLVGPEHSLAKVVALSLTALVVFLAFAQGDHRVTARSVLEPALQRAAVAPFDGYLAEAEHKAGETVAGGALLARLDSRDLRLEQLQWSSQLEQLQKQARVARADRDAAQARIAAAGVDQARARLDLLEEQLGRAEIRAPFDGVIVAGDLSQQLGAPVERGDVLFEVAPLDAFRLIVQVDESDIRGVEVGQEGSLILASSPGDPIGLRVTVVTPVSSSEEGSNYFRVEAELDRVPERLRPGMEGIAKIDIGRRHLVWIWTHEGIDWLRLTLWRWLP